MNWTQITVTASLKDSETVQAIVSMTVPYGLYIEDYSDIGDTLPEMGWGVTVDESLLEKDAETVLVHVYIPINTNPAEAVSFIKARLESEDIAHEITCSNVRDEDWSENWKKYYKPERIGKNLVVCPSWETYDAQPDDIVITLDPGSAFGTGQHESTRLCLEFIEETVTQDSRFLDIGCGSGILSIAALKFGAAAAYAVDIDKNSVETTRRNAGHNGFAGGMFAAHCGDIINDDVLDKKIGGGFDVIAVNIVADIIVALKDILREKLNVNGALIVSGIIDTRADEVLSELEKAGFVLTQKREQNGWVSLKLKIYY